MIGIDALVPQSIDRGGPGGTGTRRRVRKCRVKHIGRLEHVAAEIRIGRRFLHDQVALGGRGGKEMRIAVHRRNVEAADRIHACAAAGLAGKDPERLARACPAGDASGIQRVDFLLQAADEIVIESGVVILDGGHRQRGKRYRLAGKIRCDIRDGRTEAVDGTDAIRGERRIRERVDAGIVERAAIHGKETVRNHVIRRDEAQRRQSLGAEQHAFARRCGTRKVGRERKRFRDAGVRARERMSGPGVLSIRAERLAQHDELHAAVGVRVDLVDDEAVKTCPAAVAAIATWRRQANREIRWAKCESSIGAMTAGRLYLCLRCILSLFHDDCASLVDG